MEKIYIVTAGDSFTDSHLKFIDSENKETQLGLLEKLFFHREELLNIDYALKYQYFLIYELIEKKIPFEYYNVGIGSAGNHVIVHRYKKQINELLDKGINPKQICGTIQLSGLARATDPIYEVEFDLPNVENANWDYIDDLNQTSTNYSDVLTKHIENIENIIEWNKKIGIEKFKLFFGWAIYFEDELKRYHLEEKINKIDTNFFYYYEYKESKDIYRNNCVGLKKLLNQYFNYKEHEYVIAKGFYGGMTEIAKEGCEENKYPYISYSDQHLNSFGNYVVYKKMYRKFFKDWNLIDEINEIEINNELFYFLQFVFDKNFEYFDLSKNNKTISTYGPEQAEIRNNYKFKYYREYLDSKKILNLI